MSRCNNSTSSKSLSGPVETTFYPHESRRYLRVPYPEREECKALGGRWDRELRLWYLPLTVSVEMIPGRWIIRSRKQLPPRISQHRPPGRGPSAAEVVSQKLNRELKEAFLRQIDKDD